MASSKPLVKQEATTAPANNNRPAPCTPISQPRIRTNIFLLKPLRFYIPDDDDSVPYAFMLGHNTVENARGCKGVLLSGYFSALCAVLPDLTVMAKEIVGNLGFKAEEIAVPSQADRMGIKLTQSQDMKLDIIKLSQMLLLPFQIRFDSLVYGMWEGVARDVGVNDLSSVMVCSVDDLKTISSSLLESDLKEELRSSIASSLQALAVPRSSFGRIISKSIEWAMKSHEVYEKKNCVRLVFLYEGLQS